MLTRDYARATICLHIILLCWKFLCECKCLRKVRKAELPLMIGGCLSHEAKKKRYKSNHSRIRMVVLYLGIGVCGKPNTRELFKSEKSLIKKLIFFKINNHHPLALCVSALNSHLSLLFRIFHFSLFFPARYLIAIVSRVYVKNVGGVIERQEGKIESKSACRSEGYLSTIIRRTQKSRMPDDAGGENGKRKCSVFQVFVSTNEWMLCAVRWLCVRVNEHRKKSFSVDNGSGRIYWNREGKNRVDSVSISVMFMNPLSE